MHRIKVFIYVKEGEFEEVENSSVGLHVLQCEIGLRSFPTLKLLKVKTASYCKLLKSEFKQKLPHVTV